MTQRKQLRKERADERKKKYDQLTFPQRIIALDLLFGMGEGAKKQRAKIQQQIELAKQKASQPEQPKADQKQNSNNYRAIVSKNNKETKRFHKKELKK